MLSAKERRDEMLDAALKIMGILNFEGFDLNNPDHAIDMARCSTNLAGKLINYVDEIAAEREAFHASKVMENPAKGFEDRVRAALIKAGLPDDMEFKEITEEEAVETLSEWFELEDLGMPR